MKVVLGGRERSVGGWATYEATRRAAAASARDSCEPCGLSYSALDAAESLAAAVPADEPHAAGAARRLAAAFAAAAASRAWWTSHDRLTLPGCDLEALAAAMRAAGAPTLEQLEALHGAALAALANVAPPPGDAAAYAFASQPLVQQARARRAALVAAPRLPGEGARAREARALPCARALELLAARTAAFAEQAAGALSEALLN